MLKYLNNWYSRNGVYSLNFSFEFVGDISRNCNERSGVVI